jgi:hypothetical protein
MRVSVLSDSIWEAKLEHATRTLTLREFFEGRSYGGGLQGLSIILNARDAALNHRRRERFTKQDRTLSFDVMLPTEELVKASHQHRRDLVCDNLCSELASTLRKRKFADFDVETFIEDFSRVAREDLQGEAASRFDHLCLERATGH